MSKFIRILIIINGIIIPVTLLLLGIILIKEFLQTRSFRNNPDAINVENIITKNGDTLIAQGLRYNSPETIYNSTNYFIKVMPKTFDSPQKLNSSLNLEGGSYNYMDMDASEYYLNILFLDNKYNVTGRLLDKKASIISMTIPLGDYGEEIDTTVKNIAYLIAFNDSNNDKKIDWNDKYDLYISDLNGKELIQVTKDIDVQYFKFINNHSDVFISYVDRSDIKDEYKITRFSIYNIKTKNYRKMTSIDNALRGIQKILN